VAVTKTTEELLAGWQTTFDALRAAPWNAPIAELESLRLAEAVASAAHQAALKKESRS